MKKKEHVLMANVETPRCIHCNCDEDDIFVGNEECIEREVEGQGKRILIDQSYIDWLESWAPEIKEETEYKDDALADYINEVLQKHKESWEEEE